MRLRRLELENYRRHRHAALDFQDGVTAIVGPNGAGKSSLLEAIGFALYGPKGAGTSKDLIRSEGAPPGDSVRVVLELEVAGQALRIVRELRGKAQNPMAMLEVDGHVQVQPIAGSSEQVTQQVERLLGLDRDGFFQTVVARQRDLDRLARLPPRERREFILGLVGIGAVDDAVQRAREGRSMLRVQADEAARHVGDPQALATQLALAQQADADARTHAEHRALALAQAEQTAGDVVAALDAAQRAHSERAALLRRAEECSVHAGLLRRTADSLQAEVAAAQMATTHLEDLRARAVALDDVAVQLATAQGLVLVRARRSEQEARIAREAAALNQILAQAAAIVVPEAVQLAPLVLAAEAAGAAAAGAERAQAVAVERATTARRDASRLAGLDGSALCPACRQPVTGEHLARERAAAAARLEECQAAAAACLLAVRAAQAEAAATRATLAAAQEAAQRAQALARQREHAASRAADLQASLTALTEALPPDPGPPPDLEALRRQPDAAKDTRAALATAEAAAARLAGLRRSLLDADHAAQTASAQLADLQVRLATQADAGTALEQARQAAASARLALASARAGHTAALLASQSGGHALRAAQADAARDSSARGRLQALQADLARWTAVVGAAGGGLLERFREHLVARTAPAINQEASHLLALFTQGRYTELILDESYEVWMGDGGVLHPLERYSGGEQDLAHLALRLALSRLLATRANAPEIRFLALDEVFSSLDSERCSALLGALQRLGGLYSQVLAVTHIERLQEAFDAVVQVALVDGESQVVGQNG